MQSDHTYGSSDESQDPHRCHAQKDIGERKGKKINCGP